MSMKELIAEAISLPVEERAILVDTILKSLNPSDSHMDRLWAAEARRRLAELRSGQVEGVPGDVVFSKIWERFSK